MALPLNAPLCLNQTPCKMKVFFVCLYSICRTPKCSKTESQMQNGVHSEASIQRTKQSYTVYRKTVNTYTEQLISLLLLSSCASNNNTNKMSSMKWHQLK